MRSFLENLRVIELSSILAGPAVGMFFAELGAKVIKVENKKTKGDATRSWRLPNETQNGVSSYFSAINYRKEYLQLDLGLPSDLNALYAEVAKADILISNFQPAVAAKFQVGYADLRKLKTDLIFLQLDGFLSSDRAAYDVVLQAETGWIAMTGNGTEPAKLPVALIDVLAGHQLKEAALLALLKRERKGSGSLVTVNLEQTSLAALANQASNYLMNGAIAQPIGTRHPNIAPYGDWFATKDGARLVLAIGSDGQFLKLCKTLEMAEVWTDRFAKNKTRLAHRGALCEGLQTAISTWDFAKLGIALDAEHIPYGKIRHIDEVLGSDAAKAMTLRETIDGRETTRLSGNAFTTDFLDSF